MLLEPLDRFCGRRMPAKYMKDSKITLALLGDKLYFPGSVLHEGIPHTEYPA
jgi:hypothetical protein